MLREFPWEFAPFWWHQAAVWVQGCPVPAPAVPHSLLPVPTQSPGTAQCLSFAFPSPGLLLHMAGTNSCPVSHGPHPASILTATPKDLSRLTRRSASSCGETKGLCCRPCSFPPASEATARDGGVLGTACVSHAASCGKE